jgi:hypothetical protein
MFSWLAKAFDTALRLPETMDLKQVSDMIIDAFDNVMGKDSQGLQESRHAPKKDDKAKKLKYSQQVGPPSVHFSLLLSVRFSIVFCAPDYIGVFAQAGHAHVVRVKLITFFQHQTVFPGCPRQQNPTYLWWTFFSFQHPRP